MRSLSLSGASTKIPMLAGAAIAVCKYKKYRPDIIVGTSAGAIIALPLALGLYEEVEYYTKNFTLDEVFTKKPVNNKGNITARAISRLIAGKQSLGTQDALRDTLKKIVSMEKFVEYRAGNYPIVFLGTVEYQTGKRYYINLKGCSYDEYLDAVIASSSIPIFVESVKTDKGYLYDGGVRDHIGSHWLMENAPITENISIYSRPKNYNITDKNWKPKNVLTVLERTIEIMNMEISKNDEQRERELVKEKNILNTTIFPPYRLSTSTYEVSKEKLNKWYEIGFEEGLKYTNKSLI